MKIPDRVTSAIRVLDPGDQDTVIGLLTKIDQGPLLCGSFLPFPHQPGTLGASENGIFITYRLNDGEPEVGTVQKMLDISDLFGAIDP